jgi:hypothetical protein
MTGFNSKRKMAQDKLTDDDDAQGYIAEYEAALLVSYQSGFADGKKAAQRKPLTDEQIWQTANDCLDSVTGAVKFARAIEAAHNIKEQP